MLSHQAMVWRYLRFLECCREESDDLTQETFLSVLGKEIDGFGAAGTHAYLRRVAKNAFLKLLEREQRRRETDLEIAEAAYEWYRGADEGESTLSALDACLAELPDRARAALALRFGERLEQAALATRLGIGVHGVKSLLQRSYARLRVCVERRLRDERA